MATLTPNNGFILPSVNDPTDQDLWGGYLNENFEALDDLIVPIELPASIPIGAGMDYWGTTAPSGFIFPFGQAINRTTFSLLFAVMGTAYGAGDGSTTFNLPDKRDRASFAKGDMGGTPANRITNKSGGWNGNTLGAAGGAEQHTLTVPEIPPHTHSDSTVNRGSGTGSYGNLAVGDDLRRTTITGGSTGGGGAHNNLPPGIVCNYIIFTGVQ
jgi:microcystin-dependent protein